MEKIMDYVKAFVVGGLICVLVQILMEKTKLMPGRIMVLLVCTGAVLGAVDLSKKPAAYTMVVVDVALVIGLVLEVMAFSAAGASPAMQVVGLVIAPVASAVLTLLASKFANKQMLAIIVCTVLVIGVAVARYAFYATCAL